MNRIDVEQLVSLWRARLGLQTWEIEVVWPEDYARWPENENKDDFTKFDGFDHARIWRAKDYENARLYVNPDKLETHETRSLEVDIVHELLHLVFRETEFILDQIDGQLHRDVSDIVEKTFVHHMEASIDKLAYRLVDLVTAPFSDSRL